MLRKIGFTLLTAVASFSTPTYSMMSHSLQQGVTLEYELPSHEPQLFINYMFWTIDATCKITSEDENVELFAEGLAKKGKINDIILSSGQSLKLNVHSGESIKLSADSGAKVQITNLGNHLVRATCTT
ncbi:hypothetical protein [Legionella maioricensis]|uniref:Uncharacterized protein n=1 Tax=Legionella maioricensis TaxID=2896528 RepID=A0A9X2D062_9GAMM|nr:hypothetical protein [Legionella maioricensis]MCL9683427.1 hypothetical protein [Legionella maioricensis]MCL9688598.1 hypothetical protein [Legionella maioricensis]